MAFPLKDVRFTVRRPRTAVGGDAPEDSLPVVYPRLLRDQAIVPQVGIALGYFESMVGKERREFDPELLVQFFGDHKLARCMVACLARHYRFRAPLVAEVVSPAALSRLQRASLADPRHLRLALYDTVNDAVPLRSRVSEAGFGGYLPSEAREDVALRFERRLRLKRGQFERLLHLDDVEHAILVRTGESPAPAQVVAYYNFDVLETLLRRSEQVDVAIGGLADGEIEEIQALCREQGVSVETKRGGRATLVRLRGRQDVLGGWSRHGRRVALVAIEIVRRHRGAILDAGARVALRDKSALLRLTPELLGMLDLPAPAPVLVRAPVPEVRATQAA